MSKQTPVEWYVAESDAEWLRMSAPPPPDSVPCAAPTTEEQSLLRQFLWGRVTILLILANAGGWWWPMTQVWLLRAGVAVTTTTQRERQPPVASRAVRQTAADGQRQFAQEDSNLHTAIQADILAEETDTHFDKNLHTVEFWGEQAVARVIIPGERGAPAFRQARFYQRIGPDWRQVAPNAALWGPERSLETLSFVFHFRQNDAPVVIAVAPQVETLYTTFRQHFGLSLTPGAEKPVIEVSVTQGPGYQEPRFLAPARILVPSPAVYQAPVELTDAELLAQSIALPLLTYALAQASEQHQIHASWQPLLNGLYLWRLWNLDLPLSVWQEDIVKWIYVDLPLTRPGQAVMLPSRYSAICAAHKLWVQSPVQLNLPLMCAEWLGEDGFLSAWGLHDPLTDLDQLVTTAFPDEYPSRASHRGHTVASATLVEYAVTTYGHERLPVLVAGLGQYESWDTLLPAVYGVSPAEFEAGWQAYLSTHYGVQNFH